ncbi:MAG TPA: ABC transporter permease [Thermoanaerobaculia bacterium]|jgi:predicted permease|nr:ABC transporter permease [Thermoanaerobaculia bacterium]
MTQAKSWTKRWWRRLRTLVDRRALERELDEELAFHLEMETAKLRRAGAGAAEARRRAALAFGGVEHAKEAVRDARWLAWAPAFALDLRLGARMLAKAPWLTLVGSLGMAIGVAISAGAFALYHSYFFPDLPLRDGDRIVSLVHLESRWRGYDRQLLHDFGVWKRELRSVTELGAFRTIQRNLVAPTGEIEPLPIAEMSAAGFRLAGVAPRLGRTLIDADERPGAAPVLVIDEQVWRTRFGGDPGVIGRTMRLASVEHTIVGVMPAGFGFPLNHRYWVAPRADPSAYAPGTGPAVYVFGRLAPGATVEKSQAELALLDRRLAAGRKGTDAEHVASRLVPYSDIGTHSAAEDEATSWRIMRLVIVLLLAVIAMNVGVLVYARTMNRGPEIAVRTALGATRRRIVAQLFAEAALLAGVSAALGLGIVAVGLRWLDRWIAESGGAPFWLRPGLSAGTVLHALALGILGAAIVGLYPALRATRGQLRGAIGSSGAGSQPRLGATWTTLIVVQVAAAVAVLPPALLKSVELGRQAMRPAGFAAGEFLTAKAALEPEASSGGGGGEAKEVDAAHAAKVQATLARLLARLDEQPTVAGVTVASDLPWGGGTSSVEVEGGRRGRAFYVDVDDRWMNLFGVRVLSGRRFVAADAEATGSARPVIVNRSFVDDLLGGAAVTGLRMRYPSSGDEPQPWLEIVGVIDDFPTGLELPGLPRARVYHPAAAGAAGADTLLIHLRGETPAQFAPRLRRLALDVDPLLQLSGVKSLAAIYAEDMQTFARVALGLLLAAASVLLLSAAGIHALVSFTVNKRHREIGIRTALGANARRILGSVLARAAGQLAVGAAVGLVLTVLLDRATGGELMSGAALVVVPTAASFAVLVGLLAAAGPARRALRVQPTEAIRAE